MENIGSNAAETILIILAVIFILFIAIKVFTLPISIAKNKNLESKDITTIRILTWCGLFSGITWLVALCLALSYKSDEHNF